MTRNKKSSTRHAREAKKSIVMNANNKRAIPIIAIAAVVAFAAAAGLSLMMFPGSPDHVPATPAAQSSAATQTVRNGLITHATNLFEDGQARHFKFDDAAGGTTITYFILKSTDGVIRAAFDACDVCWAEGKGYVQDGTDMVCQNCGRRFESVKVNEVQGGCNPAPLLRTIEGDRVVIRADDLKEGRRFFDFSKKV